METSRSKRVKEKGVKPRGEGLAGWLVRCGPSISSRGCSRRRRRRRRRPHSVIAIPLPHSHLFPRGTPCKTVSLGPHRSNVFTPRWWAQTYLSFHCFACEFAVGSFPPPPSSLSLFSWTAVDDGGRRVLIYVEWSWRWSFERRSLIRTLDPGSPVSPYATGRIGRVRMHDLRSILLNLTPKKEREENGACKHGFEFLIIRDALFLDEFEIDTRPWNSEMELLLIF